MKAILKPFIFTLGLGLFLGCEADLNNNPNINHLQEGLWRVLGINETPEISEDGRVGSTNQTSIVINHEIYNQDRKVSFALLEIQIESGGSLSFHSHTTRTDFDSGITFKFTREEGEATINLEVSIAAAATEDGNETERTVIENMIELPEIQGTFNVRIDIDNDKIKVNDPEEGPRKAQVKVFRIRNRPETDSGLQNSAESDPGLQRDIIFTSNSHFDSDGDFDKLTTGLRYGITFNNSSLQELYTLFTTKIIFEVRQAPSRFKEAL